MPARILIVEDERITAEDLRDILADLGYEVTAVVSNGRDAIARTGETAPDLVLMDIRIQGDMDGTETARVLRERFNVPVVYLTAHADRETLNRAKLAEPLGYIIKPFHESELEASIEIALHKHWKDRQSREREEVLTATLGALGQGVISVDRDSALTLLNAPAEAWTGWERQEALGKSLHEVFTLVDESGMQVHTPVQRVLDEGTMQDLGDGLLLVSRTGERRPIDGNIAPIRDHQGEVSGAVVVFGGVSSSGGSKPGVTADSTPVDDGSGPGGFKMIAVSRAMKRLLNFARRVAESEASTILLEGESGTGKDVLARYMHHFGSRKDGPFIPINCAAIPETLLESELFGYEKGAFTDARTQKRGILEMASSGTVFLDEIGEMPVLLQAKMLRVLEEQSFRRLGGVRDIQVDLRILAATNRKLSDAIREGKFRLDLYYRLNVIQLMLPALRERQEDILPLAQHFVQVYNQRFRREIRGLSSEAAEELRAYQWPGNVRELRNTIERAVVLEETDWIQASSLQLESGSPEGVVDEPQPKAPPAMTLEQAERDMLVKALEKAGGNQTRAAVFLGISRDALRYKMKKFNLRLAAMPIEHRSDNPN